MEFIEVYISIPFVLAVLFGTEAVNNYAPILRQKISPQVVTLFVAGIMVAVFYKMENPENFSAWKVKLLISFLGSIGMYDYIVKPLKKKFEKAQDEK
jgi:hypothetical protein